MSQNASGHKDPHISEHGGGEYWKEGCEGVSRGVRKVEGLVQDHEMQAVLAALAAGFGVGCVIGCALVGKENRTSRWVDRHAAESIGRRVMENLERILPDAISSRIHQMT